MPPFPELSGNNPTGLTILRGPGESETAGARNQTDGWRDGLLYEYWGLGQQQDNPQISQVAVPVKEPRRGGNTEGR
jgi:hypothetical protein